MIKLDIPVEGMHCQGCAQTLSSALQRVDGVRAAKADFEAKLVKVSFDEARVGERRLREAIRACGYEPRATAEAA